MRTLHTRRTARLFAPAIAALAALSLTACEDGTGTKDEGASATASSSVTAQPGKTDTTGQPATTTPKQSADGEGNDEAGQDDANADASAPENRVLCNGSNTKVTAQPVPRPVNHMLLTVTNTGSKVCDLTYYPVLRFDEMQWAPSAAKETQPQAVTTLAPGESGYAGVLLAAADGSGDGGTTAEKLTVAFQGRTPNSDGGASATPPLPAEGVYYDSSLTVTYWQSGMDDALAW
ncbi:DUF4232 domain-containing protein [Streptomyces phaeoluteigriseus]|uniref:DUF4232 domain-containing protein n=1 Tax=Streptomyces phaeoluteigriseus TaxID=114686 RepID=A0ABY4Z1M0_9ACTN|nr:DUF4232 domain-containing protein [Streptomyces phaeoluteigriseus]USQ82791.1 DUF4232 domain-containing protein [Streptomyces phaeoluteigriseus]